MMRKVLDYMVEKSLASLTIYWQGGEAMLLPPSWYQQAHELIQREAEARGKQVCLSQLAEQYAGLQLALNQVTPACLATVSGHAGFILICTASRSKGPENYNAIWARRVQEARAAGIDVQVIAVPNQATLDIGAERFYTHFVDELGIRDFQVNTPWW